MPNFGKGGWSALQCCGGTPSPLTYATCHSPPSLVELAIHASLIYGSVKVVSESRLCLVWSTLI